MQKSRIARKVLRAAVASTLATTALSSFVRGADGTWAFDAGTTGANWSTPTNWFGNSVAGGGGVAYFVELPTFTSGPVTPLQDSANITLSGLNFDSVVTYLIKGPTGALSNSITLTGAGTINTVGDSINSISATAFGHQLQLPIAGSVGLTKQGPGTLTLWNTNTYTGGTTINGGIVVLRQFGDLTLGAAGAGNDVTINNPSTIRLTTGTGLTTSRIFTMNADTTYETSGSTAFVFNSDVTGSGALIKIGSSGTLSLGVNSSYTGATDVRAGSMTFAGSGQALATASLSNRGAVTFNNAAGNLNRLSDTAPVSSQGGLMSLTGNASAASTETIGATTMSRGTSQFTVTPGAGQTATLAMGTVSRANGGGAFFTGTSLGAAPAANVANITFGSAPTLVGGGGAAGTPDVSIIPWAYGNTIATAGAGVGTNSLVTYGANGVRPLDVATEYASSISVGNVTTNNVRLTTQAVATPSTINSLTMTGATASVTGAGTLSVTSGTVLNLSTTSASIATPIDFGTAEGFIQSPGAGPLSITGKMYGSGGVTKHGSGTVTFGAVNSYTGTTTIGGGTATFLSSVGSGVDSPFGNSTTALVIAGGGIGTGGNAPRLTYAGGGTANFDRGILVTSRMATNNAATLPALVAGGGSAINFNGNITLDDSNLSILGTGAASSFVRVNGNITGNGILTDGAFTSSASSITLTGNNTFTGGVEMFAGTWNIGSDSALGTGRILLMQSSGTGPTITSVGGTHTVTNDMAPFSAVAPLWTIAGSNDIHFTGEFILAANTYQHNITNTATTYYDGLLRTAGFVKTGNGLLVITGANNFYNGPTTINAGTVRATAVKALGTVEANTVVASGASLEVAALTQEPVTINGAGFGGAGALRSVSGNSSVGAVTLATSSTATVVAGNLTTGPIGTTGATTLTKEGAGNLIAPRIRGTIGLTINNGTVSIAANGGDPGASKITALSINNNAVWDLFNNDAIVGSATPKATIEQYAKNGYNLGGYDGTNSISSTTARNGVGNTTLGVMSGQEYSTNSGGAALFSGQSYAMTDTLIKYTYFGDVDFNGQIDASDYNLIDFGFNNHLTGWANGDADYSGTVDISDYNLIDYAYVTQGGTVLRAVAYLDGSDRSTNGMSDPSLQRIIADYNAFGQPFAQAFLAQVPEPTSVVGALVIGAGAMMRRRRTR